LLEKRTGPIKTQGYDTFDRPATVTISNETYEAVAEEFAAAVRAHAQREGNKPPYQGG
jgi:hypothetical protein